MRSCGLDGQWASIRKLRSSREIYCFYDVCVDALLLRQQNYTEICGFTSPADFSTFAVSSSIRILRHFLCPLLIVIGLLMVENTTGPFTVARYFFSSPHDFSLFHQIGFRTERATFDKNPRIKVMTVTETQFFQIPINRFFSFQSLMRATQCARQKGQRSSGFIQTPPVTLFFLKMRGPLSRTFSFLVDLWLNLPSRVTLKQKCLVTWLHIFFQPRVSPAS